MGEAGVHLVNLPLLSFWKSDLKPTTGGNILIEFFTAFFHPSWQASLCIHIDYQVPFNPKCWLSLCTRLSTAEEGTSPKLQFIMEPLWAVTASTDLQHPTESLARNTVIGPAFSLDVLRAFPSAEAKEKCLLQRAIAAEGLHHRLPTIHHLHLPSQSTNNLILLWLGCGGN